jgi:hypothetical protein
VPVADATDLEVVHRVKGGAGTDFGVPSNELASDKAPMDDPELDRLVAILDACWRAVDRAAAAAVGVELRKGPRGGGRDLPHIEGHVLDAEEAYCHQLGSRRPKREPGEDTAASSRRLRAHIRKVLAARARGEAIPDPNAVKRQWSPRYAVRRSAWHALDHAWEIEDRSSAE